MPNPRVKAGTSKSVAIYALCDAGGCVRYVGKAIDPRQRLAQHLANAPRGRTPVYSWLRAEIDAGGSVSCRVLETVAEADWPDAERRIIAEYRKLGDLLNVADGGDQPQRSDDPVAKRIWCLKKQFAIGLKRGWVRDDTRAKMREAAAINPAMFGAWASV